MKLYQRKPRNSQEAALGTWRLVLIGLLVLQLSLYLQEASAQDTSTPTDAGQQSDDSTLHHRPGPFALFDMVLNPLRRTIEHARRLISPGMATAQERLGDVRLNTYRMFMRLYNKSYTAEEIPRRMALFFSRREAIVESQKEFEEGKSMFAMRENEFTDWDDDEIKKLTGVSLPSPDELESEMTDTSSTTSAANKERVARSIPDDYNMTTSEEEDFEMEDDDDVDNLIVSQQKIPASKDWRKSGCVSTPINQLKCGACYAIATMSVVESMRCINHVSSPILSPQQIVDCAGVRAGYQNYGCDGGWPTRVLKYLQDTGIAAREKCYPFVARQNTCRLRQVKATNGCTVSASFKDSKVQYKVLRNEQDILYHVAQTGPVVTVMKATDKFLYYSHGIFDDPRCTRRRDDVDHAIVIVGYGRENGVDYWLIKNSWGTTTWGQGGYGLYKRGKNACSIGHWGWVVTG